MLTTKGWGVVALGAALLVLSGAGLTYCSSVSTSHRKTVETTAKATTAQARGQQAAAVDAGKTILDHADREVATDRKTQEQVRAILASPGASVAVDPALDRNGRRAVCVYVSAASLPECKQLLKTSP